MCECASARRVTKGENKSGKYTGMSCESSVKRGFWCRDFTNKHGPPCWDIPQAPERIQSNYLSLVVEDRHNNLYNWRSSVGR